MKTVVDLNKDVLALAARELGTSSTRDTVNAALRLVADRRRRLDQLAGDCHQLGVGADITDPDVMAKARR
jgi:Arc/MetJ family transcription regulator